MIIFYKKNISAQKPVKFFLNYFEFIDDLYCSPEGYRIQTIFKSQNVKQLEIKTGEQFEEAEQLSFLSEIIHFEKRMVRPPIQSIPMIFEDACFFIMKRSNSSL